MRKSALAPSKLDQGLLLSLKQIRTYHKITENPIIHYRVRKTHASRQKLIKKYLYEGLKLIKRKAASRCNAWSDRYTLIKRTTYQSKPNNKLSIKKDKRHKANLIKKESNIAAASKLKV